MALELQQDKSMLRNCVREEIVHGEKTALVQVYGSSKAVRIEGDMPDTKHANTSQIRRWVKSRNYGWAERIDPFATLDSEVNPFLAYLPSAKHAMHRAQDEVILEAMFGGCKKGKDAEEDEYFSSSNIIRLPSSKDGKVLPFSGDNFFQTFIGII